MSGAELNGMIWSEIEYIFHSIVWRIFYDETEWNEPGLDN